MNWSHLRTFIWLRWRLMVNHWRRAGEFSAALLVIVAVASVLTVIPIFFGVFALAVYEIPRATPAQLMYAWDGLISVFFLFWVIGLMTELQRNDPLALSKFLHLPVSVKEAFLINYLSSLIRLSLLYFVPAMAAFALALVYVKGISQLAVLPSLAAFLLMITAPTYQFQGWLASLMNNPRRRRTVMVFTTMAFIMVFQLPNLFNLYFLPQMNKRQAALAATQAAEFAQLKNAYDAKKIDAQEYSRRSKEATERYTTATSQASLEEKAQLENAIRIANMVLPVGWLPMGVMSSAEGQIAPAILGFLGMTLIGSASLWRSYRSTIALFQGEATSRKGEAPTLTEPTEKKPGASMLEARLPGFSEPVSVIALGCLRSLLRSPEAKISLLTPLILGGVFGWMLFQGADKIAEPIRPLLGFSSIAFVLFGLLTLMGNQFGMDRDGFRVFVLCAAPRRDILLGKNLAYVPVAFGLSAFFLIVVQVLCPMRLDHALSMAPQFVSMFLLFCLMANLFSIYAPIFIPAGSLKAANPKLSTVLLQLLMFLFLFPLCQGLTLLPLAAEAGLKALGWSAHFPICLPLSLLECVAILLFYQVSLSWLGNRLQAREQKILETVTNRTL